MMGGGFGGCVISLVASASLPQVLERAAETYLSRTGKEAAFFPVEISSGARLLPTDQSIVS
jgi:galactokinase